MENQNKPVYPLRGADGTIFKNDGYAEQADLLSGLTKREEFARSAMHGILSNPNNSHTTLMGVNGNDTNGFIDAVMAAKEAVRYADELLNQLNQKL